MTHFFHWLFHRDMHRKACSCRGTGRIAKAADE